jgi:hypothetical protein
MVFVGAVVTAAHGAERGAVRLSRFGGVLPLASQLLELAMLTFAARADRKPGEKGARAEERHREDRDDRLGTDHVV